MKNLLIALSLISLVGCRTERAVEPERQQDTAHFYWKVQSKHEFEYAKLVDKDQKEFVVVAPNAKKEGDYFVAGPFDTALGQLKDVQWVACEVVAKDGKTQSLGCPREAFIAHVFTPLAPRARPFTSKPFVFEVE